MEADKCKCGHG